MSHDLIAREQISDGYIKLYRLRFRLPNGEDATREVSSHGEAVAVLPYDPERRCALTVRQFRAPAWMIGAGEWFEEACAGMIEADDAPPTAARREAMEELGLEIGELQSLGLIWPSPGVSTERVTLFLATYKPSQRVAPGGGLASEQEQIIVTERSLAELGVASESGEIADAKLLTLVLALRLRRPDLFA